MAAAILCFAAIAREIEIGFENLVLGPRAVERHRGADLARLVPCAARAGPREIRREEAGELHAERGSAARAAMSEAVTDARRDREPVDAVVDAEAAVLGGDDAIDERPGNLVDRHPCEAAAREIDADAVEQAAVAVVKPAFRWLPRRAHAFVARHGGRPCRDPAKREKQEWGEEKRLAPALHGIATVTGRLGRVAWISGEYIASTRVGGSWKVPEPLRRTAYSTV